MAAAAGATLLPPRSGSPPFPLLPQQVKAEWCRAGYCDGSGAGIKGGSTVGGGWEGWRGFLLLFVHGVYFRRRVIEPRDC
jgi:hypothetical protein